jgi:hypothetical protein
MRGVVSICVLIIGLTAFAQEEVDSVRNENVLFEVYMHYQSDNRGPQVYLYDGDRLHLELTPNIGKVGIVLIRQTEAGRFQEEKLPLVSEQAEEWTHDYDVIRDGLYSIWFEKDETLGYVDAKLTVTRIAAPGKETAPTSARIDKEGIWPGTERFLTRKEVETLKKSSLNISVDKEVSSSGVAYCEAYLSLKRNQKVVIHLRESEESRRTHLVIFRKSEDSQTVLLDEYQYGIEDFGFAALNGGEYVVQFWGPGVFKRLADLEVEVGY